MVKKLLQPVYICGFILVLLLVSISHLMFGSPQSSKWHYIVQQYYVPTFMNRGEYVGFRDRDLINGTWQTWYKSGEKKYISHWLDGKAIGKNICWYKNGSVSFIREYVEGKRLYKLNAWYENGQISDQGDFEVKKSWIFGEPIGTQTRWHENGTKSSQTDYENNDPKISKHWYENGKLKSITNYVIGTENGKYEKWYKNGKKKSIELIENYNTKSFTEWHGDGTLNKKEYYDDIGNFQKRELFKDNKLIKIETKE